MISQRLTSPAHEEQDYVGLRDVLPEHFDVLEVIEVLPAAVDTNPRLSRQNDRAECNRAGRELDCPVEGAIPAASPESRRSQAGDVGGGA